MKRLRGEVSPGGSQASPVVGTEPGVAGLGEDGTGPSEIPETLARGFCRRSRLGRLRGGDFPLPRPQPAWPPRRGAPTADLR